MTEVKVTGADGVTRRIPAEHLLVFFGLQPKLGPIADWGLTLERKQIVVDTARFETNIPGVFAVGDINIYLLLPLPSMCIQKNAFFCSTRPRAQNCTKCSASKHRTLTNFSGYRIS